MLLEGIIGSETFRTPNRSCQINLFFTPTAQTEETVIHMASRDPSSGCRLLHSNFIGASNRSRHHGQWVENRWDVWGSSFVRLSYQIHTELETFYRRYDKVIRMREAASLTRISMPLTGHPNAERVRGYLTGRFDILPLEYLQEIGYELPPRVVEGYDNADLVTVDILERGEAWTHEAAPRTVETRSGREVVVPRARSRRMLSLKKPKKE